MFENRENKAGEVRTIMDSEVINHCFADINMFKKYEKFETLLTGKMVEKGTSFGIVEKSIIKMVIKIGEENVIDLILQNMLHTPGLYPNLIFIPKICGLRLDIVFGVDNVIVRFKIRRIVIWKKY